MNNFQFLIFLGFLVSFIFFTYLGFFFFFIFKEKNENKIKIRNKIIVFFFNQIIQILES
jgi:membrane protein DedA with SNARE-associated domain